MKRHVDVLTSRRTRGVLTQSLCRSNCGDALPFLAGAGTSPPLLQPLLLSVTTIPVAAPAAIAAGTAVTAAAAGARAAITAAAAKFGPPRGDRWCRGVCLPHLLQPRLRSFPLALRALRVVQGSLPLLRRCWTRCPSLPSPLRLDFTHPPCFRIPRCRLPYLSSVIGGQLPGTAGAGCTCRLVTLGGRYELTDSEHAHSATEVVGDRLFIAAVLVLSAATYFLFLEAVGMRIGHTSPLRHGAPYHISFGGSSPGVTRPRHRFGPQRWILWMRAAKAASLISADARSVAPLYLGFLCRGHTRRAARGQNTRASMDSGIPPNSLSSIELIVKPSRTCSATIGLLCDGTEKS